MATSLDGLGVYDKRGHANPPHHHTQMTAAPPHQLISFSPIANRRGGSQQVLSLVEGQDARHGWASAAA